MAILVTNAYANSSVDTVKQIVSLAESGDIFNLTNKTSGFLWKITTVNFRYWGGWIALNKGLY